MLQRYMPGLDTSLLDDDQLFRKYRMLIYMLKMEGVDVFKIKSLSDE